MRELSILLAGFSAVACLILCVVYLFYLPDMKKTVVGKIACCGLMWVLAAIQLAHALGLMHEIELLASRAYVLLLALVPVAFYFFSRSLLFHDTAPDKRDLFHLIPLLLALLLPVSWVPLVAFSLGFIYTLHILRKILALRAHLQRFEFERFFFGIFFAMTIIALLLGLCLPFIGHAFFYHAYAGCVSIAMVLVVTALLAFPELLTDVLLASEIVYAKSQLSGLNTAALGERLESLMKEDQYYENENLSITLAAKELGISGHQLSELVNTRFGLSFPRYVRQHRIEAAKRLLLAEPDTSVLAVGLSTGFKSQSSFYAAFREVTGQSPAAYRKEALAA